MNIQYFKVGYVFTLLFTSSCYAHQGKQFESKVLIEDAKTACLRNDPAAARAFLQMQIRKRKSGSDFNIAKQSLHANALCVALQSLSATRARLDE